MFKDAYNLIEVLSGKGFESYLVGGCVRDLLMQRPLSDIDIATSARPEEVVDIFKGKDVYVVPTGFEHGTVTVVVDGVNYEVTTFRKDVSTDGRRAAVEFGSSIEEDLLRRDFTINAVAYSPRNNEYIDPYGGRKDMGARIIRVVGGSIERFREDYLRMIRAHRFEAVLEFAIDAPTHEALVAAASEDWQSVISVERIREEVSKCFRQAPRPSRMFDGMRGSGILKKVFPELERCYGFEQNRYHDFDLYRHTLLTIDLVSRQRPVVRWAALFHDLGKMEACENYGPQATFYGHEKISVEMSRSIMKRYKFGKNEAEAVINLVGCHMYVYSEDMKDSSVRKLVARVGRENLEDFCMLSFADKTARSSKAPPTGSEEGTALVKRVERMAEEEKIFKIKDLAIGGREVMEIKKIPSSSMVGEILALLYDIVVEDASKNTEEQLKRIVADL